MPRLPLLPLKLFSMTLAANLCGVGALGEKNGFCPCHRSWSHDATLTSISGASPFFLFTALPPSKKLCQAAQIPALVPEASRFEMASGALQLSYGRSV